MGGRCRSFPQLLNGIVYLILLIIALLVSMTQAGYWILFICLRLEDADSEAHSLVVASIEDSVVKPSYFN